MRNIIFIKYKKAAGLGMRLSDGVLASYEQGLILAPRHRGMESLTKSNSCNPAALIYQEQNESAVSP